MIRPDILLVLALRFVWHFLKRRAADSFRSPRMTRKHSGWNSDRVPFTICIKTYYTLSVFLATGQTSQMNIFQGTYSKPRLCRVDGSYALADMNGGSAPAFRPCEMLAVLT